MKTILFLLASLAAYGQPVAGRLTIMMGDAPATPTDSPGAGTYGSTQSVTLSDATAQFILYTTDGSTPACPATGTLYTGAFNISATTTLNAIGCNGVAGGGVLTSVYTITAGEPTFTHIQGGIGTAVSSGTTVSVTLGSPPTAGNAVLCRVSIYDNTLTISSIQDGNSNTYTVTPNSPSNGNPSAVQVFLARRFYAGGDSPSATITATSSAAITFTSAIACDEFHRSAGSWTFDTDAAGNGASGTTINTPSITPAVTGELLYGGVDSSASISSVNSPWTGGGGFPAVGNARFGWAYILAGSSGATAVNMTQVSGQWNSMAMAVK